MPKQGKRISRRRIKMLLRRITGITLSSSRKEKMLKQLLTVFKEKHLEEIYNKN